MPPPPQSGVKTLSYALLSKIKKEKKTLHDIKKIEFWGCRDKISYDIPLKSKLSVLFQVVHFDSRYKQKLLMSQSGLFSEINKVPRLCLYAHFLDHNLV